jgi:ABC-type transporter Mla MlaB component
MAEKNKTGLVNCDPEICTEQGTSDKGRGLEQTVGNQSDEDEWVEDDEWIESGSVEDEQDEFRGTIDQLEASVTARGKTVQDSFNFVGESDWGGGSTEGVVLLLGSVLTIDYAHSLLQQLTQRLASQDTIEIDASEVMTVDTAILQLLIVVKQACIKESKQLVIDFPSEKFIESAKLLGFSDFLEVEHAAAGFF